jgi:prepilin-type N-terminal cleavage/methylation domain-containing protein
MNLTKQKGFTLIELMIVIAIIGILASIAIPQFSAMRVKAYNSAATSDLHQLKLVQESLYSDFRYYGDTVANVTLAQANGAAGPGALIDGSAPLTSGSFNVVAVNSALNAGRSGSAAAIAVSNGVYIEADTTADQQSSIMVARHKQGDRAYGADSDSTSVYWAKNKLWIGTAAIGATIPAAFNLQDDFSATPAAGGVPVANWSVQ